MLIHAPSILITGNIASGKSTLAKGIHAAWPQLNYACVDHIRVTLKDQGALAPMDLEHRAAAILIKQVQETSPLLYESSGATQLYRRASAYVRGYRRGTVVRIRTTCGHALAMQRFHARKAGGHKQVPPPFRNALPIQDCWYRFEDLLREPVDLLLDTGKLNKEEALAQALEYLREKLPEFPDKQYERGA